MATVASYRNYEFSSGSFAGSDYIAFEKQCRSELKKMCKEHGFNLHQFSKGHYEWSAVLEKDGRFVYVSMSDVRFSGNWYESVLVRTMAHDKDWRGGHNNYASWDNLMDMAERILNY